MREAPLTVRARMRVPIVTGTTNTRTEAANSSIKQLKRTGHGLRNERTCRTRIRQASTARRRRMNTIPAGRCTPP